MAKNVVPIKFAPKKVKIEVDEKKKDEPVEISEEDEVEVKKIYDELMGS